jgi:hypothetical protein
MQPTRLSEYFDLKVKSEDLEFLDIYANQDIQLFLDPYGISAMRTPWSKECELYITGFFQCLVDSIRAKDKKAIKTLLSALHEVDEIALGYSSSTPNGRGIGISQAKEIQTAFESSFAVTSGDIKDIADCALMIPGINRDKISDITANILKMPLIEFTQKQCKKYNIPTQKVPINNVFDYKTLSFTSFFAYLPVINDLPKILLPISSIRRNPQLSKDKYYRNFVLEFLRAEHLHAGDALATLLKNGRVVVRISDLKQKFPLTSEFLYKFSKDHPEVLDKYKAELRKTTVNNEISKLQVSKRILSAKERAEILSKIKPGNDDANRFHKISYDNLIQIFGVRVSNSKIEAEINNGRKRIDIVFDNVDNNGFFKRLNALHHVKCAKIFVECKNYGKELNNPEIDQLQGRFSDKRGNFGILICRSVKDKKLIIQRCKDIMNDKNGYVIVLEDNDIIKLLDLKEQKKEAEIDEFLSKKIDELIM